MKKQLSFEQVKAKLAKFCAYQERCSKDVFSKMEEFDLTEDEMIELIRWLSKELYLDDYRYACSFVRGKFSTRKWGRIKIKHELKKKDILEKYISKAILEEIDEELYWNEMNKLLKKKKESLGNKIDFATQKKVQLYLQQKGYEWSLIKEALLV